MGASGTQRGKQLKYAPKHGSRGEQPVARQSGNGTQHEQYIFVARNNHGIGSGEPPRIDASTKGTYCGYFQNEHGEQALFVYNYDTKKGTLWLGDAGWDQPAEVIDGKAPQFILGKNELMWLQACWDAATTFEEK
jgi:hypothetical protein